MMTTSRCSSAPADPALTTSNLFDFLVAHNRRRVPTAAERAATLHGAIRFRTTDRRNAEASTDVTMRAEVLSYSRARGLFAGISLAGSTVRPDNGANENVYGKKIDAKDIVFKGAVRVPASAEPLVAYLNKKSPKNLSDPNSLK